MRQNPYDIELFSNEYDTMRKENKGTSANDVIEIPTIRKMMPEVKGKAILDLGCGYGENAKYWKEQGASSVLGIDISKHMIELAKKENQIDGVEYQVLPMEEIDTLQQKFDIIVSSLAIHYVEDFEKLVKDIHHLLKEDGVFLFSQEHPISACLKFENGIEDNKITIEGKKYALVADYNRVGLRNNPWNGVRIEKYFRNFQTIINTLVKYGFMIEEINECEPTEKMIEKNPKYINQYDCPYFLFVKVHK